MAKVTKTTGPLHFEDLDPHRFEDLVRQLIYDFKPWRKLEPTGRSGGDEGFDARGFEIVPSGEPLPRDLDDEDDPEVGQNDRLWLIQCKREKSITPKKLRDYLDTIPAETRSSLYGVVFAAACDFSIKARDTLIQWARENGIAEAHLWGKADLEDQLYQPKNDHLLFAYFGMSLQIRQRSVRTALRARLAMKKRAETIFGKEHHSYILLRDPTDDRYPYTDDPTTNHRGKWQVVGFRGLGALGLHYQIKRHFAYIDDKSDGWDIIEAVDVGVPSSHEDHWAKNEARKASDLHQRAFHVWDALPATNRANYYEEMLIPYEEIFAIDEAGDEYATCPHVYVDMDRKRRYRRQIVPLQTYFRGAYSPDTKDRAKHFPEPLPPVPQRAAQAEIGIPLDDGQDERLRRDP